MTIRIIAFPNSAVVYWDRSEKFKKGYRYQVRYNGREIYTDKTHVSLSGVIAGKEIVVGVALVEESGKVVEELGEAQAQTPFPKKRIDVTQAPYHAVGDGKTLNTAALQRAFNDCKAGEAIYIPKGIFLTGALDMHSDMELYLEEGGVLQGTANVEDYLPKIRSRFEGIEGMCYRSLLNMGELDRNGGYHCKNVVIRGKGAILGGGKTLMENTIMAETGRNVVTLYDMDDFELQAWRTRGRLINISNTQNVIIYGIEAGMGPAWNIHMTYSDNIVTAGCYIHSEGVHNGDGWDPDSSTNCTLFDCDFRTRDDMVAIKSGKNPEGLVIDRPSRNIRVFDCHSLAGHGLAIGSEMSGGVENVYVWDCDIAQSFCGLEIKATPKRGGYVKNVRMYNCQCPMIAVHCVSYNDDGDGSATPPVFEDFYFEDIAVTGVCILTTGETRLCSPIVVCGFDDTHTAKNIAFKNIIIQKREEAPVQTVELHFTQNVCLENVCCE